MKQNSEGGYDLETHHLLVIHEPPASLVALRKELLHHKDILDEAQKGATFEECIGIIAAKLDIVLDGSYNGDDLCSMLVDVLRKRHMYKGSPHLRHSRLVDAELLEKEGSVEIVKRDRNVSTILPDGAVVTDTDTPNKNPPGSTEEPGGQILLPGNEP